MNKEITVNFKQLISFIAVFFGTVIPSIYYFAQKNVRSEYNLEFVLKELVRIENENLIRIQKNSTLIEQQTIDLFQHKLNSQQEINKIIIFINDFLISENKKSKNR